VFKIVDNMQTAIERHNAVKYFAEDFLKNEGLKEFYSENSRYTFKEKLRVKKFFEIIKKY
jgi:hypothetical protein